MSDLKQIALEHAVKVSSDGDMALATAKKFHAFLTGTLATTAATDKPAATAAGKTGTAAGKAKVATPEEKAAAKLAAKQAAEAAAQDAEGEGDGPTKEQAGAKIKELIAANLREEGKALLEEFGATALSSLKAEDYGMFIEKADELLMGA